MRGDRTTAWRRRALGLALGTAVALLAVPTAGIASSALDCRFRGPGYPALDRNSRPSDRYVVFITRSLTCDEARTVARRGTKTANPGPFLTFTMGDWRCFSFSPKFVEKVVAGQCVKPGTRELLNWAPACTSDSTACKNLRRGR
jgi:hypothetical protein